MHCVGHTTGLHRKHPVNGNIVAIRILLVALIVILPVLMCGCSERQVKMLGPNDISRSDVISKEELREALRDFEAFFTATFRQATNELDDRLSARKTRKTNLVKRARVIQAYHTMLEQEDPLNSLIDTWSLCVRSVQYLEEGEGSLLYDDHQQIAVDAAKKIEVEIERISRKFLSEDVFVETRENIHRFARVNPMRGTFSNLVVYATETEKEEAGPFTRALNLPMAPFRAMEGVDHAAEAIIKFRNTAERFSDIVEELPELSRWQLLMLLYDMEETEMVQSLLASASRLSDGSSRLADSAEKLPDQLRKQASILIEEIDSRQTNLQVTLDKAEKTTAAVERAAGRVDEAANSLERTAKSVNQAAIAWESAAKATDATIEEFKSKKDSDRGREAGFDINAYRAAAEEVDAAANTLRALIADADSLTPRLTWRVTQIIVLFFVLALAYRIVVVRFVKKIN